MLLRCFEPFFAASQTFPFVFELGDAMAAPGWKQGGMSNRITRTTVSGDAVPGIPGSMLNIEMRLDQLSKKMDACLEEVRGMTRKERRSSRRLGHISSRYVLCIIILY